MNSLHEFILKELKMDSPAVSQQDQLASIFLNYRFSNGKHIGLRLTHKGMKALAKEFSCHKYEHNEIVSNKDLVYLDSNMTWPYYIDKGLVVFFSDVDAAWFKMNGDSIKEFSEYI